MQNIKQYTSWTLLISVLLLSGCVNYQREMGVENVWRDGHQFVKGETTTAQLLQVLGPPSQIIDMKDRLVFYYLNEQVVGSGMILLVYNSTDEVTSFDRAVFIFDGDGVLDDYAYSKEKNDEP